MAIDRFAPSSRAEAFAWLVTLYGSGSALGAVVAGQLVESEGARAAIFGGCVAMLIATAFTTARARTLS